MDTQELLSSKVKAHRIEIRKQSLNSFFNNKRLAFSNKFPTISNINNNLKILEFEIYLENINKNIEKNNFQNIENDLKNLVQIASKDLIKFISEFEENINNIKPLVTLIQKNYIEQQQIQNLAVFLLSNILYSSNYDIQKNYFTEEIIDNLLFILFSTNNEELICNIFFAFNNIIDNNYSLRDYLIEQQLPRYIFNIFICIEEIAEFFLESILALIVNLCKENTVYNNIKGFLDIVVTVFKFCYEDLYENALQILISLTNKPDEIKIQNIININIIQDICKLTHSNKKSLVIKSVEILSNLSLGKNNQILILLKEKVHFFLVNILNKNNESQIIAKTLYTLSNFACGTAENIEFFLDEFILSSILNCFNYPDLKVKKESLYCVNNILQNSTIKQIVRFFELKVLFVVTTNIIEEDFDYLEVLLDSASVFFEIDEIKKKSCDEIERNGFKKKLEIFQYSKNIELQKNSQRILDYFLR